LAERDSTKLPQFDRSHVILVMESLLELLKEQLVSQERHHAEQECRHVKQERCHKEQVRCHKEQMEALIADMGKQQVAGQSSSNALTTPNFSLFDSTSELWADYWSRFNTFIRAHSVPEERKAQVFLTNQSSMVYKMLSNLAAQESPARKINELTMDEIVAYMKHQFDQRRFVIRNITNSGVIWSSSLVRLFLNWRREFVKIPPRVILHPFATPWTRHFAHVSFVL